MNKIGRNLWAIAVSKSGEDFLVGIVKGIPQPLIVVIVNLNSFTNGLGNNIGDLVMFVQYIPGESKKLAILGGENVRTAATLSTTVAGLMAVLGRACFRLMPLLNFLKPLACTLRPLQTCWLVLLRF